MSDSTKPAAILLVNLGSPDSYSSRDIRRFLREFLSDPRVVDLPRWLWLPLLWGVILPFRPSRLVHKYRAIWDGGDAPIRLISRRQANALQEELGGRGLLLTPRVTYAMTYGSPSVSQVMDELIGAGIEQLLVLPLFPQYSAATTGAAFDVVAAAMKQQRNLPGIFFVKDYHAHPAYIHALGDSLGEWQKETERSHLVFSFHGIPQSQANAGDPYPRQCHETARLLADRLGLTQEDWQISFQSRLGRAEWLRPYTDETLLSLPQQGKRAVTVICPGFAADCLETLEEINVENRRRFLEAGGDSYTYIPALNDSSSHIRFLADLALSQLQGWCC